MVQTELNPAGCFENWSESMLAKIKRQEFEDDIGDLIFEDSNIRIWRIVLEPKQRLPFRRHKNSCSCSCLSNGLVLTRNTNGQISLIRFEKGDHCYWANTTEEQITDLQNLGENTVILTVVEEKTILEEMITKKRSA